MTGIVKADKKHLPDLMEIESACFSQPWSENAMLSELEAEGGIFVTALDGIRAVGFCAVRVSFEEAELYQIAVHPDYRRRAVASMLMQSVILKARQEGAEKMFLEVRASNKPAIGLYEKYGFTAIAKRKNYYDNPREDAVIMELKIDSVVEKC